MEEKWKNNKEGRKIEEKWKNNEEGRKMEEKGPDISEIYGWIPHCVIELGRYSGRPIYMPCPIPIYLKQIQQCSVFYTYIKPEE
jgi:hypothetical protein